MGKYLFSRGKYQSSKVLLTLGFTILGILTLPITCAWGQNFSAPIERQTATEYLATKSGILIANARTGECIKAGKANQKLQIVIDGKVVATEEGSGPQQSLSITHPIPKNSRYRVTISCPSAYATAFFIESEKRPELFETSEKLPFNSSFLFPQHGIVIATATTTRCQFDTQSDASQRLSFRSAKMSEAQFIEERDSGESHTLSIAAPLLGNTQSVIELECDQDSIQKDSSFFPFSGSTGIIKAAEQAPIGSEFVPSSDGFLVLSARSGTCLSNNQILQRVSIIVDGETIADEQSYGVNRSLSVTVPVQRGSRVRPESACPLAEGSALFYPVDVLAPVTIPECLDKKDNDADGLIDSSDPGCRSLVTSSEKDGTSECQDGADNDADGSTDYPSEFGCASLQDNDESDSTSQCQDGIDNDGDGAVDGNDKGCASTQDNQENDEPIECNDRIDNDNDGLLDLLDPGCDSLQDRSEFNEESKVRLYNECIQDNRDNTYTAYLTYENRTPSALQYVAILPSTVLDTTYPETLLPGLHRGTLKVVFSGQNVALTIIPSGLAETKLSITTSNKKCLPIIPSAECIDSGSDGLQGTFGYHNPNPFEITLPNGSNNLVLGAATSTLPTTRFKPGRNAAAFSIPFKEKVLWLLQGLPVELSPQSPTCPGGCVGTSTIAIRSEVNTAAISLAEITVEATKFMRSQVKNLSSLSKKRLLKSDIRRATSRAQLFLKEANSLMVQIPTVIKSCPNAAAVCTKVSHFEVVEKIRRLLLQQESATKRFISRTFFALNRKDSRRHPLVIKATKTAKEGIISLMSIPLDTSTCG
jgi:hypothetical protein